MRLYLNVHELMAVGAKEGIFDEDDCKGYWVAELNRACVECRKLLEHMAADPIEKGTYSEMARLNNRCQGRGRRRRLPAHRPHRASSASRLAAT